jgi:hypothetical protein
MKPAYGRLADVSPHQYQSSPPDDSWPQYGPPQYGAPQYGTPQYGAAQYGMQPWEAGYPRPVYGQRTAPAYGAAALFFACAILSFVLAAVSWDGVVSPHFGAAVIGVVFSNRLTGNIDFGISATMTVACTTLTCAAVLVARLAFARWILIGIGAIVSVYYVIALVYLLSIDAARFVGGVLIALFLWLAATVISALPTTARAMRGRG